jgi:hypothetical protein
MFSSFLLFSPQFFEYADSGVAGTCPLAVVVLAFKHFDDIAVIRDKPVEISLPAFRTFSSQKWRFLCFDYRPSKLVNELLGIFHQPSAALSPAFLSKFEHQG